jgi:hypothetical protein
MLWFGERIILVFCRGLKKVVGFEKLTGLVILRRKYFLTKFLRIVRNGFGRFRLW